MLTATTMTGKFGMIYYKSSQRNLEKKAFMNKLFL